MQSLKEERIPCRVAEWLPSDSPVSGTVRKAYLLEGTYFAEAASHGFDAAAPNDSQAYITELATRAVMFIEADNPDIGLICFLAVGMAEVSTCEMTVYVGQHVNKGDPGIRSPRTETGAARATDSGECTSRTAGEVGTRRSDCSRVDTSRRRGGPGAQKQASKPSGRALLPQFIRVAGCERYSCGPRIMAMPNCTTATDGAVQEKICHQPKAGEPAFACKLQELATNVR
jgi:hypothetical protein